MLQLVICLGAFLTYLVGRRLAEGSEATALSNAAWILQSEAAIGLDLEQDLQAYVLRSEILRDLVNLTYVWLHWPVIVGSMLVLYGRERPHYLRLRNALMASGIVCILVIAAFPKAPPRFLDGFSGTVDDDARRLYLGTPLNWSNQYAAIVSFHVGWTLIACVALAAIYQSRVVRLLLSLPPALVTVAVISTGNHYFVDVIVGAGIAMGAYLFMGATWMRWHRIHNLGWLNAQRSTMKPS